MADEVVIRAEGLSKRYRIGAAQEPYGSLRESLARAFQAPFRRRPAEEAIWAVKDVSFEIKRGEVVGIIGRNGAGKSTLLKILSRITKPTEGRAVIRGRIGSLLEVGTGFHPELTGRENIYLNGAILGMHRREIQRKFDEMVDFAEIEKFLDTPVKYYSSGMYVRLAFAVAAHLEPEILLVDEVLAVGDAAFQKKCLGKMGEVAEGGRTVVFVSHNLGAVTNLCPRALLLESGQIAVDGPVAETVNQYMAVVTEESGLVSFSRRPDKKMCLREVRISARGELTGRISIHQEFKVSITYEINEAVDSCHVICFIYTMDGTNLLGTGDADLEPERLSRRRIGLYTGEFTVPGSLLGEGQYYLTISMGKPFVEVYDRRENVLGFTVIDLASVRRELQHIRRPGLLGLDLPWLYNKEPCVDNQPS